MADSRADDQDDRLARLLNDERARRAWAERELLRERERTATWRSRAEHRQAMLVAARSVGWVDRFRSLARRLVRGRRAGEVSSEPAPDNPPVATLARSLFPTVVAVGDHTARNVLKGIVDLVPLEKASEADVLAADFVAVSSDTNLSDSAVLVGWSDLEARPPLLRIGGDGDHDRPSDVRMTHEEAGRVTRALSLGRFTVRAPRQQFDRYHDLGPDGLEAQDADGRPLWVLLTRAGCSPGMLERATEGVPLLRWSGEGEPPLLDLDDRLRASVATQRYLWATHGPESAARDVLSDLGIETQSVGSSITAVLVSNRPDQLETAIDRILRSDGVDLRLVVGMHGSGDPSRVSALLESGGVDPVVVAFDERWTLGRCLNEAMAMVQTDLWAKIDDDDHYGAKYLLDGVVNARLTGADLVGKPTYFAHLAATDETYLVRQGREQSPAAYMPGASFVGRRRLWEDIPFAHRHSRVDSTFLTAAARAGAALWASTRFEFQVSRSTAPHTWQADPAFFAARGERVWQGDRPDLVDIRDSADADGLIVVDRLPGEAVE